MKRDETIFFEKGIKINVFTKAPNPWTQKAHPHTHKCARNACERRGRGLCKSRKQQPINPFSNIKNQTSKSLAKLQTLHHHQILADLRVLFHHHFQSKTPTFTTTHNSIPSFSIPLPAIPAMGPIVLTQLATGLSVLAGAAIVKRIMDQNPMMGSGREPRCPSCNGTGRVSCMCTRWSDGDYGCRACAGSGRAACNKCGGSGTGRPIPVQISVLPRNPPSWRYSGLFVTVKCNPMYVLLILGGGDERERNVENCSFRL